MTISVPARAKHTASVIFVHGLGDSGAGWSFLPELMATQNKLAQVKWILPNAPLSPVTLNGGMKMPSWYDITSLESINQVEDERGMMASVGVLHSLIDSEVSSGIDSRKIVIAGFSQGCAMALLAGITYPAPLGGIVGLSGYLPLRSKFETLRSQENRHTPLWMGHGTSDPVVNYKYGQMSAEALRQAGMNVSFNSYPGVGHTADIKELSDLASFLEGVL